MSYFAKVPVLTAGKGLVEDVIRADQAFIDTGYVGDPSLWWQTSYNTHGGQHATGGTPFRYNYAGIGYTFDPDHGTHGAFIPPRPYPSWVLNADTALWDAPTPMPAEGMWSWDEPTLAWVEVA